MEKEEWIKHARFVYEGYTKIDYETLPDPAVTINESLEKRIKTVSKPTLKQSLDQKTGV